MQDYVSPKFTHDKLVNPTVGDLIDVFEDLWQSYLFDPVNVLLSSPNGDVAAMTLLSSYYESIQSYISGESSQNRSKEFFVKGFLQIFSSASPETEKAANEVYKHIRCGLVHESMLHHKVAYSRAGVQTFFLTYPKNSDGTLNTQKVTSIVVNPQRMYDGTVHHFHSYVQTLREGNDQLLIDCFQKTVKRQWATGTGELIVGMTQDEFLGKA